jgi:hypothetical protein
MEVLNDKGRVNMLEEITRSGTKNKGKINEVPSECEVAKPRFRTLEKHRCLIIDAIKKKAAKKYGPDNILVVVFDDYVSFRSDQEMADLKASIARDVDLRALDFGGLYLLSSSGNTLSELPLRH